MISKLCVAQTNQFQFQFSQTTVDPTYNEQQKVGAAKSVH